MHTFKSHRIARVEPRLSITMFCVNQCSLGQAPFPAIIKHRLLLFATSAMCSAADGSGVGDALDDRKNWQASAASIVPLPLADCAEHDGARQLFAHDRIVVSTLEGAEILDIGKDDVEFPMDDIRPAGFIGEQISADDQSLTVDDIMNFRNIKSTQKQFYDVVCETRKIVLDITDKVPWGHSYKLLKRNCPRCTLCNKCCERSGAHKLCSHGCLRHLWRSVNQQRGCFRTVVEGYVNGNGLETVFSKEEIAAEKQSILTEFHA